MMSKPKFTPGPWMYRPNPGKTKKDWTFHIDRQGTPGRMNWGVLIAACWDHVTESAEANARLIAAAPDLYAALTAITDQMEQFSDAEHVVGCEPLIESARAALARVESEAA